MKTLFALCLAIAVPALAETSPCLTNTCTQVCPSLANLDPADDGDACATNCRNTQSAALTGGNCITLTSVNPTAAIPPIVGPGGPPAVPVADPMKDDTKTAAMVSTMKGLGGSVNSLRGDLTGLAGQVRAINSERNAAMQKLANGTPEERAAAETQLAELDQRAASAADALKKFQENAAGKQTQIGDFVKSIDEATKQ